MRTTVTIDDELLTRARTWAAQTGRTLNAVVEDALRKALERRNPGDAPRRLPLPSFTGSTLRRGVNLDDTSQLLDVMEGLDA
jgi:hypothetical protein